MKDSCGGCRARALAETSDILETDPLCLYEPSGEPVETTEETSPQWSAEAEQRLERIPIFLRAMVRKSTERHAKSNGIEVITPELMAELKKKAMK